MAIEQTGQWNEISEIWSCPGCLRKKAHCEVTTEDGKTLRWIVDHHDHMRDYVKAYLKKRYGSWSAAYERHPHPEEFNLYIDLIKSFVQRFKWTPVCLDCNEIEGRIKTAINADRFFSFHAHEIRRAMIAIPNKRHIFLDENMPFFQELYAKVHERLVVRRKQIIETLVDESISGLTWWGGAVPLSRLFSEDVLLRRTPEFDSSLRIEQGLKDGKAVRRGAAWSKGEEQEMLQLRNSGASIAEIAKQLGRTATAISLRLEKLGVA